MTVTRRWVMKTASAGAGVLAVAGCELTSKLTTLTRYNATSPKGKAMLGQYAKAVNIMRNQIPATSPLHWNFQWYSHWIPGPAFPWSQAVQRKQQVISQIYGAIPPTDPRRALAEAMWDGCQAHGFNPGNPQQFQETFFLPWHRYFVYYFESIVRAVLKDPTFTLPYWNYLGGTVADLSIPPEFYQNTASPLFQPNRNTWVNQGQRIDMQNPGALNLNAFNFADYISSDGSSGLCPTLDGNPHGLVHVFTGNGTNMGSVPTAAGDPIFWLHHSNIDRLWASWNRLGKVNPTWGSHPFTFANSAGVKVVVEPNGARSIAQLKYDYDTYQQPPAAAAASLRAPSASAMSLLAEPSAQDVAAEGLVLSATQPVGVAIDMQETARANPSLLAAEASTQTFVRLENVVAPESFQGSYNVYIDKADGRNVTDPSSPAYVGTFGSFMIEGHGDMAGHDGMHGATLVFPADEAIAALAAGGVLPDKAQVVFQPRGDIGAPPTVGALSIIYG